MKERYEQELSRVLSVFESVLITLSCVSPASAVFIIVPVLFAGFGTASFISMTIASLIGLAMAFCWAELGATYPLTGGDYCIINRAIGPAWGFATFGLFLVLAPCFVPLFALGLGSYLKVVIDVDPKLLAVLATVAAAVIAILKVRITAAVTGAFLAVELVALVVVAYLGFVHAGRPMTALLHPVVTDAVGVAAPATFAFILTSLAGAVFTQAGFNTPLYLSEETAGSSAGIARAVLWSLFVVVVTTLVPITAVLLGTRSIAELGRAPDLTAFVIDRGGVALNVALSLAVAGAIFNAMIAILIVNARFLYSSGRDRAWPERISAQLARVHPTYRTPWLAVVAIALVQIIVILSMDIVSLTTFISVLFGIGYCLIALAAIVSRYKHRDRPRPYRMPLWPLPPLLALGPLAYVLLQQSTKDLWIAAITIALSLAYYFVYLARRPGQRWLIREAPQDT
jgi:amino acid transporter